MAYSIHPPIEGLQLSDVQFDITEDFVRHCVQEEQIPLRESLTGTSLKRQCEYLAGRLAAKHALQALGSIDVIVSQDASGKPIWPSNTTGSITHHDGDAIAITAHSSQYLGLGIDLEMIMPCAQAKRLSKKILTESEKSQFIESEKYDLSTISLIFSAKESLFKLLNPISHQFFGFQDATCICIDQADKTLSMALLKTLSNHFPKGSIYKIHYQYHHDKVLTFTALGS